MTVTTYNINHLQATSQNTRRKGDHLQLKILRIVGAQPCTLEYTSPATLLSKTVPSSSRPLSWCKIAQ
jgi:hypothetical protein